MCTISTESGNIMGWKQVIPLCGPSKLKFTALYCSAVHCKWQWICFFFLSQIMLLSFVRVEAKKKKKNFYVCVTKRHAVITPGLVKVIFL